MEKKAKGQVEALAVIFKDYHHRVDIKALRDATPGINHVKEPKFNGPFIKKLNPNSKYGTPYKMALYLCEQIRDRGLADSNETYTLWVMLPLIGMIHDENELTIDEACECLWRLSAVVIATEAQDRSRLFYAPMEQSQTRNKAQLASLRTTAGDPLIKHLGATKTIKSLAQKPRIAYESHSRITFIGAIIDHRSRETESP